MTRGYERVLVKTQAKKRRWKVLVNGDEQIMSGVGDDSAGR